MFKRQFAVAAIALVSIFGAETSSASAEAGHNFAGVYVGHPTVLQGSCIPGPRLMSVIIDSRGNARLLYNMNTGAQLEGFVDSDGKLTMETQVNNWLLQFAGQISNGHISGKTFANDNHNCDEGWEMDREPE